MKRVGLKFCGGCNPRIDRSALAEEIKKKLPSGWRVTTEQAADPWEKAILVCGCQVACADRTEVRELAQNWILISGPMIDLELIPEEKMAEVIVRKIIL